MRIQFNLLAIIYNTTRYLNYAFKVDIYLTQQYWIDISVCFVIEGLSRTIYSIQVDIDRTVVTITTQLLWIFHNTAKSCADIKVSFAAFPQTMTNIILFYFYENQFLSYISWACSMWYFANLANLFEKYPWFLKQYFNPENIYQYLYIGYLI